MYPFWCFYVALYTPLVDLDLFPGFEQFGKCYDAWLQWLGHVTQPSYKMAVYPAMISDQFKLMQILIIT